MWIITKGYELTDLSKKQLAKPGLLESLSSAVDVECLRQRLLAALESGHMVLKAKRKGQVVGCYVLERRMEPVAGLTEAHSTVQAVLDETADAEIVPLQSDAAEVAVLCLTERVVLPAHDAALAAIEAGDEMTAELHNLMLDGEIKAVRWGVRIVMQRKVKLGKWTVSGTALGMALGLMLGVAMKNIGVGLCFGVAFASSFGVLASRSKGA